MTVLQTSPEYYIQQCHHCGSVLRYSKHDIYVGNKEYIIDDKIMVFAENTIICPICDYDLRPTMERYDMLR